VTFRLFRSRYARRQLAGVDALLAISREQASARERDRQREASAVTAALPVRPAPTIPLVPVIPTSLAAPVVPPQWADRIRPRHGRAA
jgi:hypothetical protein